MFGPKIGGRSLMILGVHVTKFMKILVLYHLDKVNWQKVSDGEAYHASLYFEIGKTDAHGFRPTSIMVDNVDQPTMVIIEGEEVDENDNVIGEAYPYEYAVGQEDYYEVPGMDLEDFKVTEIIAAKDEEAKEDQIVSFIEGVNEADMATVESMSAETFAAPRKKPSKGMLRRGNRSRNNKNMMQMKRTQASKSEVKKLHHYWIRRNSRG